MVNKLRCCQGFSNAHNCRIVHEKAYQLALNRGDEEQCFKTVDFLGSPPTPEHLPKLRQALEELESRTGLSNIKLEV